MTEIELNNPKGEQLELPISLADSPAEQPGGCRRSEGTSIHSSECRNAPAFVSDKKVSITESVSDAKTTKQQAIQRFLDDAPKEPINFVDSPRSKRVGSAEPIACITKYSPGKRKTEYFRLSYRLGKRVKHIHIQGGSTIAQLAQYRAKKLQEMIERGAELGELIAAVQTYQSQR